MTIIRNCVSLLGNASTYCFENCDSDFHLFSNDGSSDVLHTALRKMIWDKVKEVLEESVGKKKKQMPSMVKGLEDEAILADISDMDFVWDPDIFSGIYLQALLDKIAPEEDLVLTYYYECTNLRRALTVSLLKKS